LASILASNIRSARKASGLTQHELAVALGRGDAMTVSRWERGEHRPSDEYLIALSRVLDRDVAWFYTEPEDVAA
jgi:transcriptional regulator with XRE-family HTH domain